ncbi:MAG: hypothetical protein ACD_80C00078G0005 [uncultured bacterium (gcode 4)]|uniref:Uncharacterized protein n=1 Tax=uncultured bacterium (gcode 4) TaxID=1234023 RepID=K1XJJ0_9BACT|nr:MAG: hypothetical protein ACD_80C00078G0005 [uncultured bacterium (gcode 4)]HBB04614.1 hypothetical protein [Candidatus Gracilibacteria bacterium]
MRQGKKIDKKATIKKILDWGNESIGRSINVDKFNASMQKPDWEKTLKELAKGCQVEIVYQQTLEELNPKPGQWYTAWTKNTDKMFNADETINVVVFISETKKTAQLGSSHLMDTSMLYEPKLVTPDEAKEHLEKDLETMALAAANEKDYKKGMATLFHKFMKQFYEKHFSLEKVNNK